MRIRHAFASPFGRSTRPAPGLEHRRSRYGGWAWDRAGSPAFHGRWHRNGRGSDLLSDVAQPHRRLVRWREASPVKGREHRPPIQTLAERALGMACSDRRRATLAALARPAGVLTTASRCVPANLNTKSL